MRATLREMRRIARHPKSLIWRLAWARERRRFMEERRTLLPHFDAEFYLEAYPELRTMAFGPLRHFILKGWKEGRDPSELFSTSRYLEFNGDVAAAGMNPFVHYIRHGRDEGRTTTVSTARWEVSPTPQAAGLTLKTIAQDAWDGLAPRVVDPPTAPAVNVIVPVYASAKHVAVTLHSVLTATNETAFEVLVVDDASPDPAVSALVRDLAERGLVRLLINNNNLGFVGSCNRAMAFNQTRDVVLLNADTEVYDGWLDRLVRPLSVETNVATVTALSNNATIASYPTAAQDNPFELEVAPARIDALAAAANGSTIVDVPTGVGFCMAIRRRALAEVGPFDQATFGAGYGEECDFCMRALRKGWRNVVASGVYVRHYGAASFGEGAALRNTRAQVLLSRKHPDYNGRVVRHRAADPLLASRILLDTARLREAVGAISLVIVTHRRGGGIDTFLANERAALEAAGLGDVAERALVLQTQVEGFVRVASFGDRALPYLPNLEALNIERHNNLIDRILEILDPELVHMNSFAGLSLSAISQLFGALKRMDRPYWHVWHDHQPLCPRLTFLDAEMRYCGETDARRCVPCLTASSRTFEWVRVEDWRAGFRDYLENAEAVIAPSEAAALRARRLTSVAKVAVHPHVEPAVANVAPLARPDRADGVRRVLVLGAIGPHKGAYLLHSMIADATHRALPLVFEVVGYTSLREIVDGPCARVHGRYAGDADALAKVSAIAPDLALIPSIWPETYVFTLSVVMALGLPTAVFDMGAQGERAGRYPRSLTLPTTLADDPLALNDALLAADLGLWDRPLAPAEPGRSMLADRFSAAWADAPHRASARTAAADDRADDGKSDHRTLALHRAAAARRPPAA